MGNNFKIKKIWTRKKFIAYCNFCEEPKEALYTVYRKMTKYEESETFSKDRIFIDNLTKKAYHKYWFCSEECLNCYVLTNG